MREQFSDELESYRIKRFEFATKEGDKFGAFKIRKTTDRFYFVIADDGQTTGWEHVSISLIGKKRCPSWQEMCWIKDFFWDETETVLQFHPKASNYVNIHPYVLHLWKKRGVDHELPPNILV